MDPNLFNVKYVVAAIVYAVLGNLLLLLSFVVVDKLTPGDLWGEIVKEKNLPLAVTVGAMILALGNIIASAIHG